MIFNIHVEVLEHNLTFKESFQKYLIYDSSETVAYKIKGNCCGYGRYDSKL